jgi:hypothetical protein
MTSDNDQYEVTAVSDHRRCFSKFIFDMTNVEGSPGIGCTCKTDTIETRIVGTQSYRNWQFPKGRNPFKVGQIVTLENLKTGRTTGAIQEAEAKLAERRKKIQQDKEAEKGKS